jgi:hypothetical protein
MVGAVFVASVPLLITLISTISAGPLLASPPVESAHSLFFCNGLVRVDFRSMQRFGIQFRSAVDRRDSARENRC